MSEKVEVVIKHQRLKGKLNHDYRCGSTQMLSKEEAARLVESGHARYRYPQVETAAVKVPEKESKPKPKKEEAPKKESASLKKSEG